MKAFWKALCSKCHCACLIVIKGEVIGSNPGQPSSRKLEVNVQGKILKSLPFSNGFKCRHSLKNSEEKSSLLVMHENIVSSE